MEINIRYALEKDMEDLVKIYNQAILSRTATGDITPFKTIEKKDWFLEHNKNNYPILTAEHNDKVVGWISISPYRKGREALRKTVEVSYYIENSFQRKGIGNKLLNEIIKVSKELGYKTIFTILFDINIGSIKLLKKNGFEKWGELPGVVEVDGNIFSHVYYGRKI